MKQEFEQALKDWALESARPRPRQERIISIERVLMPGKFICDTKPQDLTVAEERVDVPGKFSSDTKPQDLTVAEQLSLKRELRRITQRGLAFRAGINHSTISRIENGLLQPTLPVLGKLVTALELSPEDTLNLLKAASKKPKKQ